MFPSVAARCLRACFPLCPPGASCGPLVGGVIGAKKPVFDVWSDTVNQASRMETTGIADRIQVTQTLAQVSAGHTDPGPSQYRSHRPWSRSVQVTQTLVQVSTGHTDPGPGQFRSPRPWPRSVQVTQTLDPVIAGHPNPFLD